MTFRVMAGFSAIWAGKARDHKDGSITMPGERHDVTDDVLAAAAIWLADKDAHSIVTEGGRRITLKVEVEEAEE